MVITGTTGNRVYPKRVPRVQIPPAPPETKEPSERRALLFLMGKGGFERPLRKQSGGLFLGRGKIRRFGIAPVRV